MPDNEHEETSSNGDDAVTDFLAKKKYKPDAKDKVITEECQRPEGELGVNDECIFFEEHTTEIELENFNDHLGDVENAGVSVDRESLLRKNFDLFNEREIKEKKRQADFDKEYLDQMKKSEEPTVLAEDGVNKVSDELDENHLLDNDLRPYETNNNKPINDDAEVHVLNRDATQYVSTGPNEIPEGYLHLADVAICWEQLRDPTIG